MASQGEPASGAVQLCPKGTLGGQKLEGMFYQQRHDFGKFFFHRKKKKQRRLGPTWFFPLERILPPFDEF